MAYEPTVWTTGDVVTAEKLNKLKNGVVNSNGGVSEIPVLEFYLDEYMNIVLPTPSANELD